MIWKAGNNGSTDSFLFVHPDGRRLAETGKLLPWRMACKKTAGALLRPAVWKRQELIENPRFFYPMTSGQSVWKNSPRGLSVRS